MSQHNGIGCKGGTSATAGKRLIQYTGQFPDGINFLKTSFKVDNPTAVAGCYQHEGRWYVAAIWEHNAAPAHYTPIIVNRITSF